MLIILFRLKTLSQILKLLKLQLKSDSLICLIENPLKMMKNAFYFILKARLVLEIFNFLSRLFGHVGKTA